MYKAIIILLALFIVGCNSTTQYKTFNSGTIIEKRHTFRYEEIVPIGPLTMPTTRKVVRPEKYELIIEKCYHEIDECFNKSVRVEKDMYNKYNVGDFYKSPVDDVFIPAF